MQRNGGVLLRLRSAVFFRFVLRVFGFQQRSAPTSSSCPTCEVKRKVHGHRMKVASFSVLGCALIVYISHVFLHESVPVGFPSMCSITVGARVFLNVLRWPGRDSIGSNHGFFGFWHVCQSKHNEKSNSTDKLNFSVNIFAQAR